MIKTIAVACDGSEHAQQALRMAIELAKKFEADLHFAHAPQIETPSIVVGSFVSELEKPPTEAEIAKAGEKIVGDARDRARSFGLQFAGEHVGRGDAATHILAVARETDADLIVMGRRGLGAVGALTLGSVSMKVAHASFCALLTVP